MPRPAAALCMVVAVVVRASPPPQALDAQAVEREFAHFSQRFGKRYMPVERPARIAEFTKNLNFIAMENMQNHSYELDLNQHADLSHAEFVGKLLGLARPRKDRIRRGLPHLEGQAAASASIGGPLLASVDWRERGVATPVASQGLCGACWAFSATGALSAAWQIQTGAVVHLSQQQLIDCTGRDTSGCYGGSMDDAFDYAVGTALCTAESYPYRDKEHSSCQVGARACEVAIPRGNVLGYHDVRSQDATALMKAVAQQPVSVGIAGEGTALRFYRSGVFTGECGKELNHGVLLVGYGRQKQSGIAFWLLKNSWGPSWGDAGYFKLMRVTSGAGDCGVMTMPMYPVVRGPPRRMAAGNPAPPSVLV